MFKVGDKVICIDDEGWDCLIEGQIYIISQILEKGKVRLEGLEGGDFEFYNHRFELAEEQEEKTMNKKATFWMITGIRNAPNVRHRDEADAKKELARLSAKNPNQDFYLLQAVAYVHTEQEVKQTVITGECGELGFEDIL